MTQSNYPATIARQELVVLDFLRAFEKIQEQLHPADFAALQKSLAQAVGDSFNDLRADLENLTPPPERAAFHEAWVAAVERLQFTNDVFAEGDPAQFFDVFLHTRDAFARARYVLYDLREETSTLAAYWALDGGAANVAQAVAEAGTTTVEVGVFHHEPSPERGAWSLYVPEDYSPARAWPLIVALHGGSGANDEYLLTWLRAAKSRGYVVVSPRSRGRTWGIDNPGGDIASIASMIDVVRERYAIDRTRVLVSGLSDGGTFSYVLAANRPDLFTAAAPIAAVLPPWIDMARARTLPFLVIHGGRDFIFPVITARRAHAALIEYGIGNVTYQEIPDWGHAYTYSINEQRIVPWFEALFE